MALILPPSQMFVSHSLEVNVFLSQAHPTDKFCLGECFFLACFITIHGFYILAILQDFVKCCVFSSCAVHAFCHNSTINKDFLFTLPDSNYSVPREGTALFFSLDVEWHGLSLKLNQSSRIWYFYPWTDSIDLSGPSLNWQTLELNLLQ